MGSFNVACSISGISISYKQEIRYLLLMPNKYKQHQVHKLNRTNQFLYQDDLFKPFALPIAGRYNDAGGIQDVVKDSNTEIIEARYGMSIEDIAKGIHRKESIYHSRSPFFDRLIQNKSPFSIMVANDQLALTEFGFEEKGNFFIHPAQPKFKVKFDTSAFHFGIYKGNQLLVEKPKVTILTQVLEFIYEQSGLFLGVADEDQQIAAELTDMSAMFIHEDIYTALADSENDSIREMALPSYEFREQVKQLADYLIKHEEAYQKLVAFHSDKKQVKTMKGWGLPIPSLIPRNMYEMLSTKEFRTVQAFENMPLFTEHYRHLFFKEDIAELLFDFYYVKGAMRSANKMYLPAMNGEQDANHAATLNLAKITQQIVNAKV